jgi:hypothetical protein
VTFCYPHGANDATVRRLVEAAGYLNACSTVCALSGTEDDAFALARIPVLNDTTEVELAWMLATLPLAPLPERLRTRVWRVARRQMAAIRRARWSSGRDA